MSTLLDTFTDAGVDLFTDAGRLRYRAPKGAMTPALHEALQRHKDELLALLAMPEPAAALPEGALPLWLFDLVHPLPDVTPAAPPVGMGEAEIAAAVAEALAAYEREVQHWRDHPPAPPPKARWAPNAPCHRCKTFDWYEDGAGKWHCGRCTPREGGGTR